MRRPLILSVAILAGAFVLLQLVPYGHDHGAPPTTKRARLRPAAARPPPPRAWRGSPPTWSPRSPASPPTRSAEAETARALARLLYARGVQAGRVAPGDRVFSARSRRFGSLRVRRHIAVEE